MVTVSFVELRRKCRRPANQFFQNKNLNPTFPVNTNDKLEGMEMVGNGFVIPIGFQQAKNCLVYCFGSNGDVSPLNKQSNHKLDPIASFISFDMANYTEVVERAGAHFHPWGISHEAKTSAKGLVYETLEQTGEELGRVGHRIDIFKIDCRIDSKGKGGTCQECISNKGICNKGILH